jgi:tetratricopeptide (TPR) repeat protein
MQLSVLVRRVAVASMLQDPDAEALVAEAARALASAPGHPLLMDVAHGLIGFGRTGVAAAIAEAHIAAHPDHAIGHITLGQIIFQVVNHGAMPPEAIDEAVLHIETGLALDPTSLEGTLALASCRRFQRREGEARGLYERILERDPGCALAHYNLGVMVLDTDPATALAHFQFGQEAEPDDPDYPMGIARACVALGQMEMAREALEKVRELAPDHPLLPTIEARLS